MRILHLLYESRGDYFGTGGVATRAYEIYSRLQERHEITLLCKRYPGAVDRYINGLRHIFLGSESRSLTVTFLSYAARASRFVRRYGEKYDVIVEEFSPAIPTFLHSYTGRPLVLQVQGHTGLHYFRKYNPLYALVLYLLERLRPPLYTNFIFINEVSMKRYLWKRKRKGRIAIIPNAIPPEMLVVEPLERDYILYLGRIDVYPKGLDLLLDAFSLIRREHPLLRLLIAGDGRGMQRFKRMLSGLTEDVRGSIELLGWVEGPEKTELLRGAILCVFPSRHEIQPISVLEAMALQKPVVVSPIRELQFVLEAGSGEAFEGFSGPSLAEAIMSLLKDPLKRRQMGQRGRQYCHAFTWQRIAEQYEAFLYEVAGMA